VARVDVSTSSDLAPESAWKLACDLNRFGHWMTIFGGWRSSVPSTIERGTCVSSLIKVKGFRNVIHWTVMRYDEPKVIELKGRGRGGIRIVVAMAVTDNHPG
jgi:polyketide cyclase/dehydrase/lipid transport protein